MKRIPLNALIVCEAVVGIGMIVAAAVAVALFIATSYTDPICNCIHW